jgi:arylsulfatase A
MRKYKRELSRSLVWTLIAILFGFGESFARAEDLSTTKPNIVILLADDAGYADLGCFGSKHIKTPCLDALAKEGAKFTAFYAGHSICSPSRAALMTGRTPSRLGIFNYIPGGSEMRVKTEEETMGEVCKRHGYDTGFFGKWALNGKFQDGTHTDPDDQGFDYYLGAQNNAKPSMLNPIDFYRNGQPAGPLKGYSSEAVINEAISWLDSRKDQTKPFLMYICFQEPHNPLAEPQSFMDMYAGLSKKEVLYYGNMSHMDYQSGRIISHLDSKGFRENTLVFFSSDNGPLSTNPGSAEPYRGKKGSLQEGGLLEPTIIRWPGKIEAGKVIDTPLGFVDMMPTVREIVGATEPPKNPLDGASFLSILSGGQMNRTQPLFWERATKGCLRDGKWKLAVDLEKCSKDRAPMDYLKKRQPVDYKLYNLETDPGETKDVKAEQPAVAKKLEAVFYELNKGVENDMPVWKSNNFLPIEMELGNKPFKAKKGEAE